GFAQSILADEAGTGDRFKELADEIFKPLLKQYRGRLIGDQGGAFLMTFTSAVAAVNFTIDVQRTLPVHQSQWPENQRLRFRIGVNLGDIIVEGDQAHGAGVDITSQMQKLAEPGGLVISKGIFDQAHRRLDHVAFEDLGPQGGENTSDPTTAYRILLDTSVVRDPAGVRSWFSGRRIAFVVFMAIILGAAALWKLQPWR
ncbi:MAG: hypothetical protein HOC72_05380, partial [Rhodospirillaceae bacterium]|nr:hypothetical protein [Rhodospirillaceae bacterium]